MIEQPGEPVPAFFSEVDRHLTDALGKPLAAELSPCDDAVLTDVLLRLGFTQQISSKQQEFADLEFAAGPWNGHLSRKERRWLSEKTAALRPPASLKVAVQTKTWTPSRGFSPHDLADALLAQAMDGRAAHIDRWAVPLPLTTYDDTSARKYVRRMFRAMACRLVQNGRLTPMFHRHFVMNLWETPGDALDASLGQFAGATEFVVALPQQSSLPAWFDFEPATYGALRTAIYLALLELVSDDLGRPVTLHSFAQALFPTRRPVVMVGPSSSGDWEFVPSGPWLRDEHGIVPAFLWVGIKHFGKYKTVLSALNENGFFNTNGDLVRGFGETIWRTSSGNFVGFPWLKEPESGDEPENFGAAAGTLIKTLAGALASIGDIWSIVGGGDDTREFEEALRRFSSDCHRAPIESGYASAFHRLFLANAVWFQHDGFAHRQVSVAIASAAVAASDRFLAAGIYLVTQRHRPTAGPVKERFEERLGQLNTAQIAADAARYLLASASLEKIKRAEAAHAGRIEAEARRKIAEEAQQFEEQRRRTAVDALTDLDHALRDTSVKLVPLLGVAGEFWSLWDETPGGDPEGHKGTLACATHGPGADVLSKLRDSLPSAIRTALSTASSRSFLDSVLKDVESLLNATLDQEDFKRKYRQWQDEGSLPRVVAAGFGLDGCDDWTDPVVKLMDLAYPSVPAVWEDAIRLHRQRPDHVDRCSLHLASFVDYEGTKVRAGFVSISFEETPPETSVGETVKAKFSRQPIAEWADITVVVSQAGTLTRIGRPVVPRVWDELTKRFETRNGVALVFSGIKLPQLKPGGRATGA